jgi:hypothetical protein
VEFHDVVALQFFHYLDLVLYVFELISANFTCAHLLDCPVFTLFVDYEVNLPETPAPEFTDYFVGS